tara:strand:+ start:2173 stop:2277 length:105 start_codon:yes stop_codon:yes gene_type:complete
MTGSLKRISKPKSYLIDWEGESKIQFKVKEFLKP